MIWDQTMVIIDIECKPPRQAPQLSLNFKMQHCKRFMRKHKFCSVIFGSSFSLWCVPGKRWPHSSSRVSSYWDLRESDVAENVGSHFYFSCDSPMNHFSSCQQNIPSYHWLSEKLGESSPLGFFFPGTLLFPFIWCQSRLAPWHHCDTWTCFSAICGA